MKWETLRAKILGFAPEDLAKIKKAFDIMDNGHDVEYRDDGRPYRDHPIEAFLDAYAMGERDVEVLCAILTHDVIESTRKLGRPLSRSDLERDLGSATACRVLWMTKEGHTEEARARHWEQFRACKDRKMFKAKCIERLNNVKSFGSMKATKTETKDQRIKRKVNETVRVFVPVVTWLEAEVEICSFPSAQARNNERAIIKNIRNAFERELGRYGVKFR